MIGSKVPQTGQDEGLRGRVQRIITVKSGREKGLGFKRDCERNGLLMKNNRVLDFCL